MIRHDGTNPETIPEPIRCGALAAAEDAIDRTLRNDGYHLDYVARLELLRDAPEVQAASFECREIP